MDKKIFVLLFFAILLVGVASALEFDNIKSYDELTKTVTVENAFGLGSDIAKIKLNTPLVNVVPIGYGQVAEFEIDSYNLEYLNVLQKMEFHDVKDNMRKLEKDFEYKVLSYKDVDVNEYEYRCIPSGMKGVNDTCSNTVIGTHKEQEEVWSSLKDFNLAKGVYTIGIYTEVYEGDNVEWIPTMFGREISEWATYEAGTSHTRFTGISQEHLTGPNAVTFTAGIKVTVGYEDVYLTNVAKITTSTANFATVQNATDLFAVQNQSFVGDNATFELLLGGNLSYYILVGNQDSTWMVSRKDGFTFPDDLVEVSFVAGRQSSEDDPNRAWAIESIDLAPKVLVVLRPQVVLDLPTAYQNFTDANILAFDVDVYTYDSSLSIQNVSLFLDGVLNQTNTGGVNGSYQFTNDVIVSDGKHNYSILAYGNNSQANQSDTREFWMNTTPQLVLTAPDDDAKLNYNNIKFNLTATEFYDVKNVSFYLNGTLNETDTSGTSGAYVFSKYLADGYYTWYADTYSSNTASGVNQSETRNLTIDTTLPAITIAAPNTSYNYLFEGQDLFLNFTATDTNLDSCLWDYNGTNYSVACSSGVEFKTLIDQELDNFNVTVYANDSSGNVKSATRTWTFSFFEGTTTFEGNVTETSNQAFSIDLDTTITVLSISALLSYNGTNYTSDASCTGGSCTVSNLIDVPLVLSGKSMVYNFSWVVDIFNGTSSTSVTTSTQEQNVSRLYLESCAGGSFINQSLNFTTYDEQSLARVSPFSFDGTFDFWIGGGTVVRNSSLAVNLTEVTLCLHPNETIKTDANINYDSSVSTDYTDRFYYLNDFVASNVSQDIYMYLLNSSASTSFILKVQDESLLPVTDALIEVHRYYPGTGTFKIVQVSKTDDNGKSIGFFQTETVDYKFIIKKNGVILLETGQQKVVPEVSPYTLTFNTGDPLGSPWEIQEDISSLESTLVWNETSEIVSYVYIDTSGLFSESRLLVVRDSLTNSSNITIMCNESSTLNSATLTCDVGDEDGFYTATAYINRGAGEVLDRQIGFQIETLSGIVGLLGLFYGFFLILVSAFVFKFNEIAGIWAMTITVFLVNIIGLINFGGVFVTAMIAVAIIITWVMER